jgi:hypothetical protein
MATRVFLLAMRRKDDPRTESCDDESSVEEQLNKRMADHWGRAGRQAANARCLVRTAIAGAAGEDHAQAQAGPRPSR